MVEEVLGNYYFLDSNIVTSACFIFFDPNKISPSKQIVIKGIVSSNKEIRKWSLEKI